MAGWLSAAARWLAGGKVAKEPAPKSPPARFAASAEHAFKLFNLILSLGEIAHRESITRQWPDSSPLGRDWPGLFCLLLGYATVRCQAIATDRLATVPQQEWRILRAMMVRHIVRSDFEDSGLPSDRRDTDAPMERELAGLLDMYDAASESAARNREGRIDFSPIYNLVAPGLGGAGSRDELAGRFGPHSLQLSGLTRDAISEIYGPPG